MVRRRMMPRQRGRCLADGGESRHSTERDRCAARALLRMEFLMSVALHAVPLLTGGYGCSGLATSRLPAVAALIVRHHGQCSYVGYRRPRRLSDWRISVFRDNLTYTALARACPTPCPSN